MPTNAGEGEHHVYRVAGANAEDRDPLQVGRHYIGIDAVAWFINKESGWFHERMASGTLDIVLSGGLEKYQAALGTYELKRGARVAPVFQRPVLPDRNFLGGPITLRASLTAIKQDTALGGMLKSAANASLGIVAGMVQTASVGGPAKLLADAGEDLIGGVRRILGETGEKREPLFDFHEGLEFTMQPHEVVGPEMFVLLHRGALLPQDKLSVARQGEIQLPYLNGRMLDDGAWLLLRLRRSSAYSGVRDWFESAKKLRRRIKDLVSDVANEVVEKADALKRLKPSSTGDQTLFDEFSKLRAIISADGVLSEVEVGVRIGELDAVFVAARKAISAQKPIEFETALHNLSETLNRGGSPTGPVERAFATSAANAIDTRRALSVQLLASASKAKKVQKIPQKGIAKNARANDLFRELGAVSQVLELGSVKLKPGGTAGVKATAAKGGHGKPSRSGRSGGTGSKGGGGLAG
jgi:hypothetical protein